MGDEKQTRRVEGLTPEEAEIARQTPGGTVDKLRAVFNSRPPEERARRMMRTGIEMGIEIKNAAKPKYREPEEGAQLTRLMPATELARLIGTVDRKGHRFIKDYINTLVIAAKPVEGKDRVWVFDADELLEMFPSLEPSAILRVQNDRETS